MSLLVHGSSWVRRVWWQHASGTESGTQVWVQGLA